MNNKNIIYLPTEQLINNFINKVVEYIIKNNGLNENNNYIVIGNDYLYLEDELLDIINMMKNNVELFIEKSSIFTKLILDIDFKWTLIYGYKIIFKKETDEYYHIKIYRPKITILYLTDKINDVLENCKKSIYKYCKKYNYVFIHQSSILFNSFYNRLEYTVRRILDDEYIVVLYNYSFIVNYELSVIDIIRILCMDKYTISLDYVNNKLLKNNLIIRNSRRLVDIVKELKYFENDDEKMLNYIKSCISNDINICNIHSYINKKSGYYMRAGFLDLVHTMNNNKDDDDNEYETINIIQKHMSTKYLNGNEAFFNIVDKTYTIGNIVSGCNGTITFMKDNKILYALSEKYGEYKKLNSCSYDIILNDKRYILIFFNNYKRYIGSLIEESGDAITGNLLR
jgi:hypothetical protein